MAVDRAPSLRAALGAGLLMSIAFAVAVFGWLGDGIAGYTGSGRAVGWTVLALLGPLLEPQLFALAAVRFLLLEPRASIPGARNVARDVLAAGAGAFAYVAAEWAYPKPLGDTLGHGFLVSRILRQGADLGGAGGLVLVLVFANGLAASAVGAALARERRRTVALLAGAAAPVLALALYGGLRLRSLAAASAGMPEAPIRAALVQANVGSYGPLAARVGTFEAVRGILDLHFLLTRDAAARDDIDLVIWPETVYPTTFAAPKSAEGAAFDREIAAFASAIDRPLVFGAYDVQDGVEYNAAFFLEPAGGRIHFDAYRKRALFPLTERVPPALDLAPLRAAFPWLGTWVPGDGPPVLTIGLRDGRSIRVAPAICYDAVDPRLAIEAVRAGAQLIVTLSNDAWFATGAGPLQHLVVAAFRSIETRRPQLRATTTGISAVIDATGEIIASAGVGERAVVIGTVTPAGEPGPVTLALRWGDWLGPTALALAAAALAFGLGQRHPRDGRGQRGSA